MLLTDNSTFGFVEQAQTTAVMLVVLTIIAVVLLRRVRWSGCWGRRVLMLWVASRV